MTLHIGRLFALAFIALPLVFTLCDTAVEKTDEFFITGDRLADFPVFSIDDRTIPVKPLAFFMLLKITKEIHTMKHL